MCGITGVFDYARARGGVTEDLIIRMRDSLVHRGPDGSGVYISPDGRVGLGHRRLSIVDPDHGQQPMAGPNGLQVVFNGEIYNFPDLKSQLESEGVRFRTRCDTEVLLHLYARDGLRFVDRLIGMFAFVIWDPDLKQCVFARDPVGEKPLFWADRGGTFVFGSEVKALLAHGGLPRAVNESAIGPYLANLVAPEGETLYEGIHKLRPGTIGVCNRAGVRLAEYSSVLTPRTVQGSSYSEAVSTVRSLLSASVADRLMSDVPVGVLLSGGIDSSIIAALLHERAHATSTFTVGFPSVPQLDERGVAARIATHFGTDHHEVALDEQRALGLLPSLVHHADEPLADPVCVPLYAVTKLARDAGIKVVLAGEGADELFWGYPGYLQTCQQWRRVRALLSLPRPVRRALAAATSPAEHGRRRERLDAIADGRPGAVHFPVGLTRVQRRRLLRDDLLSTGWQPTGDVKRKGSLTTLMFDTQEYEFAVRLPELLLMRIDRFSMANGVEARVPFLDPALIRFVYGLPLDVKLRGRQTKALLRAATADLLPAWVLDRPKTGFGAPTTHWFQSQHGRLLETAVDTDSMKRYFDLAYVKELARARDPNEWAVGQILWPILMFALWHHRWIEGQPVQELIEAGSE